MNAIKLEAVLPHQVRWLCMLLFSAQGTPLCHVNTHTADNRGKQSESLSVLTLNKQADGDL